MSKLGLKRKLGWLEAALYVGGVALLAVFFFIRGDADRQREEGIAAFQAVVERSAPPPGEAAGSDLLAPVAQPDTTLWAEKRIAEYERSLEVQAAAPQAVLTIPRLNIEVPVYDGADEFNLNRGVARIRGTARVGEAGNLGIAGHRDGFFRGLKDISIGDGLELQTTRGIVRYAVSSIEIVEPSDVSVLAPTEENTITLVTCYPFYYVGHAPQRYIVTATAEHLLASN
jgi:sortase A